MPTGRPFSAKVSLPEVLVALNSVGAHLAAKLEQFASDERTLTDELCDMLCIWSHLPLQSQVIPAPEAAVMSRLPAVRFGFDLRKTTAAEEAQIGADLELVLNTPAGSKRALIQAKVFEGSKNSLRYDSARDWGRLRKQLRAARHEVGSLAYLLVYVPASLLSREMQGFPTWEQGVQDLGVQPMTSSKYGSSLIPAEILLNGRNGWRYPQRVWHAGSGSIAPMALSLAEVFMEMVSCRRGTWSSPPPAARLSPREQKPERRESFPYRRLEVTLGEPEDMTFDRLAAQVRAILDESGPPFGTF